jgi:hypothetical protein
MFVRAEIMRGILKKIVLALDGKNSFKNPEEVDFQFMPKKQPKIPLFGPLKSAIT